MNDGPKISIIIPVYGVEKYINECVDSVLKQDYDNFEVILVDDGSKDNCPQICDEYAKQDSRVKVIHKVNGGLSDARNKGVEIASGDYICFLDGDDFWDDSSALTKLADRVALTNAEVINFSYKKFFDSNGNFIVCKPCTTPISSNLSTKQEQLSFLLKNNSYIASAWNKIIKKAIFSNKLKFKKGVYSEDIEWCAILMCQASSFDYVPLDFYCYRQRKGSISHTISEKNCTDLANSIISCIELANNASDDTKDALLHYSAFQFATFFIIQACTEKTSVENINKLKPYSYILKYHGNNKKITLLNLGCKILGFKNICRIVRKFYKTKV